jgi:hypothetical protein
LTHPENLIGTLDKFKAVARPIMLDLCPKKDTCIRSTAIAIGVLRHFGISAVPFRCRLMIFNPAFMRRVDQSGQIPSLQEGTEWLKSDTRLHSIGVGTDVGHLVALVENKLLLECSLDQVERPDKHISLPAVASLEIEPPFDYAAGRMNGCGLWYEHRSTGKYKVSPEWVDKSRHTTAVSRIIEAMDGADAKVKL